MVNFLVEKKGLLGRLGSIDKWGSIDIEHATPSCMVYLRAGHIPHLTWDVVQKWLKLDQKPIFQLTLPGLIESAKVIEKFAKGAPAFCGIPKQSAVHLSITDPLAELKCGYNDSKSVAIWCKGGKKSVDVKLLRELIGSFGCNSFETLLDYDTPRGTLNKRLTKAVDRTKTFYEQMFSEETGMHCPVLVSLGGGFSEYHRRKCAVDVGLKDQCDGYSIDLHDFVDGKEVDRDELKKLVHQTFAPLPPNRLRYASGAFDPSMILFLSQLGIDLFDSSYVVKISEEAKAFLLADDYPYSCRYELMDFKEDRYADDFTTPFDICECYTCKNYTKGYLHHLNNAKELLCSILLVIHNMTEYQRMFSLIRKAISEGDTL